MKNKLKLAASLLLLSEAVLRAQETSLETIIITATRGPRVADETRAASVLGARQIEATPAKAADEVLRSLAGVSMRSSESRGANAFNQQLSLRGVGEGRTLVLADGIPLNDPFFGHVNWNKIPKGDLERIEALRGASSGLHGNLALGGVVQLFTRSSGFRRATLEADYGQFNAAHAGASVSGPVFGEGGLRLFGDVSGKDGYFVVAPSRRGSVDTPFPYATRNFGFRTDWKLFPGAAMFASGSYFRSDLTDGTPATPERLRSFSGATGLDFESENGHHWRARLFGSRDKLSRDTSVVNAARTAETISGRQRVPVFDLGGSLTWWRSMTEKHTLTAGLDMRQTAGHLEEDVFNNAGASLGMKTMDAKQRSAGFFAEWRFKPEERWTLTAGVRGDQWKSFSAAAVSTSGATTEFASKDAGALSPSLGASFRIAPDWNLRAAGYSGFRAPNMNELYRLSVSRGVVFQNNPDLNEERVMGGEAGADWSPGSAGKVSVTGFYNHMKNLIQENLVTSTLRLKENLDAARSYGVELESICRPIEHLELGLGYVRTYSEVTKFTLRPASEGKWLQYVPRDQAAFTAGWRNPRHVNVLLRLRGVGVSYADPTNDKYIASFMTTDITLSKAFGALEVFLSGSNVFDREIVTLPTSNPVRLAAPRQIWSGFRLVL